MSDMITSSHTYDFSYIFTIIYLRTLYTFKTDTNLNSFHVHLDESITAEPSRGPKGVPQSGTGPVGATLIKTPAHSGLYMANIPAHASITPDLRYLSAEMVAQLRKQILLILQVAHQQQADSFTFHVSGLYCYEPVVQLLQQVFYQQKGIFHTIHFCCPNETVKTMYQEIFRIAAQ
jgi:hypothetical protein